jgi:multimeric flavodoxin WrbA
MRIAVLNGSPKGELSVTLQYVKFIQRKFGQHEFEIFNISHDIQKIERQVSTFRKIISKIKGADGVLWVFPLYVLLVPAQYKRFIELIRERKAQAAFKEKYTAVLSTSVHFYDHTAHNYMRAICDDLDMKFVESFSADMDDIFSEEMRKRLLVFANNLFEAIQKNLPTTRSFTPIAHSTFRYAPGKVKEKVDARGKKVVVITDAEDGRSNMARMVRRFERSFSSEIEVVNLHEVDMKGGCLGCGQCAFDNICVYQDGFVDFFNSRIRDVDIVIYASTIKDRYLSSRHKMFWDRSFFNGHTPVYMGKQIGFIISGPLGQIPNLRQILEAKAEMSQANLVDIVTDECGDSTKLDDLLQNLANKCVRFSVENYVRPVTFLGVGGHKIFRDLIWARARFPFVADYRFYKKHRMFDFPQKDKKRLDFSRKMLELIKTPEMKEMVRKMAKSEMVKPYKWAAETDRVRYGFDEYLKTVSDWRLESRR